jgi:hypothetical protein
MSSNFRNHLCLLILGLFLSGQALTQDGQIADGLSSLRDYLQQAFAAKGSAQRPALAHIGIQAEQTNNGFLVTAVLEDYPAFNAEIYRGDVIESAAGAPFHPIHSFASRAGDSVQLLVRRGDARLEVSVKPVLENLYDSYRTATLNSIQEFSAGNKVIGYLRPWALSKNTADLVSFANLMQRLDHCDALIFDLRDSYGYVDQLHRDSLMANDNHIPYFEKSVVVLFNENTADGPMELIKQVMGLQRIDTLSGAPHLGVAPEMEVAYPKTQTSRYDPQYDAALNRLLGII